MSMEMTKTINGCEVSISFKPQSEDIKDKVLWLILECFKSRLNNFISNDSSNSLLHSK